MKTLIGSLMVVGLAFSATPQLAQAKPIQSRPGIYEEPCMKKGDVNRCMELGYRFMHEKGKNSRKLARFYFEKACELKTQKSCTPEEAKLAARDFTQSNRAVASQKPVTPAPAAATTPVLNATSSASTAPTAPAITPPTTFGSRR